MDGTRDEAISPAAPFEIVLRGFDRQQVTEHVNALKARVATIGAERDAALQRAADLRDSLEQLRRESAEAARQMENLRREAAEAAGELDRLQRSPLAAATARIQRMLQMAEDEAAELRATTERETTSLQESARTEADRMLTETTQQCERLDAEATRRRQSLETESTARRQQVERQLEQDIASRQADTEGWIHEYQTRSVAALYLLLQIAGERLSSRTVNAKRQVSAARQLRSEVTGQLSEVHRLLVDALGVVETPTPAEQSEVAQQAEIDEPAEVVEQTKRDEPPKNPPSPAPPPAAGGGGDRGATPTVRWERPRSSGRPRQADQPTARFGLHP
ncbi:MAG TPA: hypothetical protein VGL88_09935 [Pseudonocardiaceae bacterium]|jgi:chromosome segregation ATPase